ncbi:MAG: orotate phosphoribosyltransferase [Candidatus Heimdallarchaeaceae archaeon]
MTDTLNILAKLLVSHDIIKFGSFTLKSGAKSWYYVDLRLIPSYPEVFKFVIDSYITESQSLPHFDAVAGVAVAAIPFSSVIGYKLDLPSLIIRKQSKEYGLKKMVEGKVAPGSTVLLVDDVITTGGSKVPGILALREKGFEINDLLVLIDRSKEKIKELEELNVSLHSVAKIDDIFKVCLELPEEEISTEIKEIIEKNI